MGSEGPDSRDVEPAAGGGAEPDPRATPAQGLFGGGAQTLDALARPYPAGTVLFEEGDPGSRMYVLRSGRVKISKRVGAAEILLAVLGPGDFFGEMALLEGLPRTATATVIDDSRLIEVDESTFEGLVRRSGEISVRLLKRLSQRLREADRQIQSLLAMGGVARLLETVRSLAGPVLPDGRRALAAAVGIEEIALRSGQRLDEARRAFRRLQQAGVVVRVGEGWQLEREAVLADYALYLELQEVYDPLTAEEMADISGLPEEEVHRIIRRLLDARLAEGAGQGYPQRLADSYQTYLELKRRFEYPDRPRA